MSDIRPWLFRLDNRTVIEARYLFSSSISAQSVLLETVDRTIPLHKNITMASWNIFITTKNFLGFHFLHKKEDI